MNISGKKVAVLVDNYFEQAEFEEPISALIDAGADVTVIAVNTQKLKGLNHIDKGDDFEADLLLDQASSDDYDALVLPGGAINADSLRTNEKAQRWALDFLDSDRPIAVICHAPWLLVSAEAVDDRRLTSWASIKDDILNAGGEWVDRSVVVDNNLITSRKPDDIPMFNEALIRLLAKQPNSSLQTGADIRTADTERENELESSLRALGYDRNRDRIDDDLAGDIYEDIDVDDPDQLHISSVNPENEQNWR